ncbi:MAG: PDZ domain-containing protein [Bacteroidales bacterium]|nr:PDZ domain-containing protein [Bacteroidales bacterium]
MEDYNNSKKSIVTPILLSIVLVAGMLLGYIVNNKKYTYSVKGIGNNDKIEEVQQLIQNYYFEDIADEQLTDDMIRSLLAELDPHTSYMTKEETKQFEVNMSGEFNGVGIQFNILKDTLAVVAVTAGGPSERAGILPGDKILSVDKENIAGVGIQNNDVLQKLRGKKGTVVALEIYRKNTDKILKFNIKREPISIHSIPYYGMLAPQTGYINIDNFTQTTAREFHDALLDLSRQGMDKLILDLRGNPGGYLGAAIAICDELLPAGEYIVYTQGKNYPRQDYKATKRGLFQENNQKVAVLIDEYSASASEIVAGAVQDNERGIIAGRRSFGKGLVQTQFVLRDSSVILLTVARYYTPLGRCIQRPFEQGKGEEYYNDIYARYENGELQHEDSISFNDTLKVLTRSGKVLYGGGGIMPDVFVPLLSSNDYVYFNRLFNSGIIYEYAAEYVDNHRNELKSLYPDVSSFIHAFSITDVMIKQVTEKGNKEGIQGMLSNMSKQEMQKWLKAYIGRMYLGDKAFYPVVYEKDEVILKALTSLKKQS